jgi:hypothetical protein
MYLSRNKIIFIICVYSIITSAQVRFTSAGIYIGGGLISGNSPNTSAFTVSPFADINFGFNENLDFRFGLFYGRDANALFSDDQGSKYYPYLQGSSVKAITTQLITENIYLEEGAGILILNDRSFSDVDEWAYGSSFFASINIYAFNAPKKGEGFAIGIGTEYGITFTNTLPSFYALYLQLKYLL